MANKHTCIFKVGLMLSGSNKNIFIVQCDVYFISVISPKTHAGKASHARVLVCIVWVAA